MTNLSKTLAGAVCALSVAGCAAKAAPPAPPPPAAAAPAPAAPAPQPPGAGVGQANAVTTRATVTKIDHAKRMVTLRGEKGNSVTFRADERVKNLPQVKAGDEVLATYYESVAIKVEKAGQASPGVAVAEEVATAPPGEKPAGVVARVVTVTATITAIDKGKSTVTVKGPEGNSVTAKVQDPRNLEGVKAGDLVQLTLTEALAIEVETPAQKTSK